MKGVKVICEANGKRSKYDLKYVQDLAKDRSQPFQYKVFNEILTEIEEKQPEVKDFDDRYTVYFVSPASKKEFENTGRVVLIRQVCYFKEGIYNKF